MSPEQVVGTTVAAAYSLVFASCALLLARGRAPRLLVAGHGGTAALLGATAALAVVAPGAAPTTGALVATASVPALVMLHPDGRPVPGPGVWALALLAALVGLGLAYPALFLPTLAPAMAVMAAMTVIWWRYEQADAGSDVERRAVLWVAAVFGGLLLLALLITFVTPGWPGVAIGALVLAPAPYSLVVATVRPDLTDVRVVVTRVVVEVVALWTVVTVYVGLASVLELVKGSTPSVGEAAVLAAGSALVLPPARVLLRVVVERLVFGDRDDPVRAASAVGRTLSDDPVQALEALRRSLALPYAALVRDGEVVAASGEPTAETHRLDLTAGAAPLGRLEIGLRPGQVRLGRQGELVLQVVVPALTQALLARELSRQLQDSRAAVIAAAEDERRRLRRDLHDGLGPTLTGIAFAADAAGNVARTDPARSRVLLATLRSDAADAIVEVRRLVDGLRPPAIDELGLIGALREQVRSLHTADGQPLAVRLEAADHAEPLPAAVEVATYRIVTEALTNVARHSGSRDAEVRIEVDGQQVRVRVTDRGAARTPWQPGVGLGSMRERAEQLGGTFRAHPEPGRGGCVEAALPLG